MKQRLAIVRALITEPKLLLMDEPFSSLDEFSRGEAQDYFLGIRKELQLTIIMVSHSIEEAVYLGDSVHIMTGTNPGTVTQFIPIDREGESNSQFRENPRFQEYCSSLRAILKVHGRNTREEPR
jgi:NitT/TauT family transport system ATP-binding protein